MYAGANKGRLNGCIHHLVKGYQWTFWQGWGCRHDARPVTRGEAPLEKFSLLMAKCVGCSVKLLDIV